MVSKIKNIIPILFILCIITISLYSCMNATSIKKSNSEEIEILIGEFIHKSYGQNIKIVDARGIGLEDIKPFITDRYFLNLSEIADQYKIKKEKYNKSDQNLLSRFFATETNVMILRPWSYQPDKKPITVVSNSGEDFKVVSVKYHENRWNDSFDISAKFFLRYENGYFRIDDIVWEDDSLKRRVSERLNLLSQSLKLSESFNDFDALARTIY